MLMFIAAFDVAVMLDRDLGWEFPFALQFEEIFSNSLPCDNEHIMGLLFNHWGHHFLQEPRQRSLRLIVLGFADRLPLAFLPILG